MGYSLLPAYWGKGFAIEAARKARDTAFMKHYASTIISIIHIENEPSKKVARNNGMQLSGSTLFRGKYPVDIFRIDLKDWEQLNRIS